MSETNQPVSCPVCHAFLVFRPARGRKSGKPFIMIICPDNARHFRGFISDQAYVAGVLDRLEGHTPHPQGSGDPDVGQPPSTRSNTNLERGSGA